MTAILCWPHWVTVNPVFHVPEMGVRIQESPVELLKERNLALVGDAYLRAGMDKAAGDAIKDKEDSQKPTVSIDQCSMLTHWPLRDFTTVSN